MSDSMEGLSSPMTPLNKEGGMDAANSTGGFKSKGLLPRVPTGQRQLFRIPNPGAGSFLVTDEEHGDGEHERKATWSELYLDISYVAVFSKLVKRKDSISNGDVFDFAMVFIPVWWCWIHVTLYLTRFDTDDLFNRLMLASVAFAVSVQGAIQDDEQRSLFAIAFCVIRFTLFIGYAVNFVVLEKARRFCFLYAFCNLLSVVLWGTSVLFKGSSSYYFLINWFLSYLLDLCCLFITGREAKRHIPFSQSHLPERMGLLTIIVLGENILNLMYNFTQLNPLEKPSDKWILVFISIFTSYLQWWLYFDDYKWEVISKANRVLKLWIFIHLPIHMLNLFFSIAVVDIVRVHPASPTPDQVYRFLIAGGLIFIFNSLMKLLNSWSVGQLFDRFNMAIYLSRLVNGLVIFLMMLTHNYGSTSIMLTFMGFCLFQVIVDIVVTDWQYKHSLKLYAEHQFAMEDRNERSSVRGRRQPSASPIRESEERVSSRDRSQQQSTTQRRRSQSRHHRE